MNIFQKSVLFKNVDFSLSKFFSKLSFSQDTFLLVLGGLTGILCGFGAIIFREAIHFIKILFFDKPGELFSISSLLSDDPTILIAIILVLIPAVGGLCVGLLAHFFEKGEEGEGIPQVIDAVASKGGVIKGSIAIKKIIGSALSIGTGGAGGKEGPIVQIGASIGSAFGRFFHLSPDRLKILVGCGAAAGLSAAFNAPLGGALFSMEIILRTFNAKTFSPILISSVFATALSREFLGNSPTFIIPTYKLTSYVELLFYIVLGLLCGLASVYFVKVFYGIDDFVHKFKKIPKFILPAIGGLVVGFIGLFFPGIYGFSYDSINSALGTFVEMPFYVFILLIFLKPIATAFTLTTGGNGGTFAPSLFTGAMVGVVFGQLINHVFPESQVVPAAYALVGMAAVVAGTTHASLTALIMVFEMTVNSRSHAYDIILPLMLTIIVSATVSRALLKGDLYSLNFFRRGKEIDIHGRKISILKKLKLADLIEKETDVIYEYFNFNLVLNTIKNSRFDTLLVKDRNENFIGQISFRDLREVILDEESRNFLQFLIAKDFMIKDFPLIKSNESCEAALEIMEDGDFEFLPVVDENGKHEGIVARTEILRKYQKEVFIQQSKEELALN